MFQIRYVHGLQGVSEGTEIQLAGVCTSGLPLHLHMQQVVDDTAAIQRAHQLIAGGLQAHTRVRCSIALKIVSLQQEHCLREA